MKKILLADDEADFGQALAVILTEAGYEADVVWNGRLALERLRLTHVDVLVTDLMMPVLDGATVVKEIRRTRGLEELPVIVMSSLARTHAVAGIESDIQGFLLKPFAPAELIDLLRAIAPG